MSSPSALQHAHHAGQVYTGGSSDDRMQSKNPVKDCNAHCTPCRPRTKIVNR